MEESGEFASKENLSWTMTQMVCPRSCATRFLKIIFFLFLIELQLHQASLEKLISIKRILTDLSLSIGIMKNNEKIK
jgi:hypothetical protein